MTKTLSEQICEECGVKPLFLCKIHSETKCETVYPDFENSNNNFVQLQEFFADWGMGYTCQLIGIDPNRIEISFLWDKNTRFKTIAKTFKTAFLQYVLQLLELEKEEGEEVLKQAIKNEQWEV